MSPTASTNLNEPAEKPAAPPTRPNPMAGSKPLWQIFLSFLAPMVLSNMLQSLSGTVNSIYVGQMLGVKAMAAASTIFPILFFFIAFIIGLGAGSSVLIGQAWGAHKYERVKAIAGTSLLTGLIIGLAVACLGIAFTEPALRALGTPADILPEAVNYARVMLIAAPAIFLFLLMTSMLRGVGDTLSPLLALMLSTVAGLLITPALIRGWLGFAPIGVVSAALATLASQLMAILLGWYTKPMAYLLAAFTLLAAALFHHNFADVTQMTMFMKNLAIAGGFLALAVVGPGTISVDQRLGRLD